MTESSMCFGKKKLNNKWSQGKDLAGTLEDKPVESQSEVISSDVVTVTSQMCWENPSCLSSFVPCLLRPEDFISFHRLYFRSRGKLALLSGLTEAGSPPCRRWGKGSGPSTCTLCNLIRWSLCHFLGRKKLWACLWAQEVPLSSKSTHHCFSPILLPPGRDAGTPGSAPWMPSSFQKYVAIWPQSKGCKRSSCVNIAT